MWAFRHRLRQYVCPIGVSRKESVSESYRCSVALCVDNNLTEPHVTVHESDFWLRSFELPSQRNLVHGCSKAGSQNIYLVGLNGPDYDQARFLKYRVLSLVRIFKYWPGMDMLTLLTLADLKRRGSYLVLARVFRVKERCIRTKKDQYQIREHGPAYGSKCLAFTPRAHERVFGLPLTNKIE